MVAHYELKRLRAYVALVAVIGCLSCDSVSRGERLSSSVPSAPRLEGSAASPLGSTTASPILTSSVALGDVRPDTLPGFLGDGGIGACYTDALRIDPDQEGDLVYAARSSQGGEHAAIDLTPTGSLGSILVECIRESLRKNIDKKLRAIEPGRVELRRRTVAAPPPPTASLVRALVEELYKGDAARVVTFSIDRVTHSMSSLRSPPELVREYAWSAEVEPRRGAVGVFGQVVQPSGRPPEIVFDCWSNRRPPEAPPARRRADGLVAAKSVLRFSLTPMGWILNKRYYCGDRECPAP